MKLYPTIGLETHAELLTESKLFCGCSTKFGGGENEHCCIGCSGFPGAMPSLNKKALELTVRAGVALTRDTCDISRLTKWERKNYFYPDLPSAYQVSQLERPVCVGGRVEIEVGGEKKSIRLNNIHLEEDAGKLNHAANKSHADYNRAGVPLIEIVTEPDFHSADEVVAYVEKLRRVLQYAEICDGKMEQGSLRCDVNISLAPEGGEKLGTRTEIKNLNSIKAIGRAVKAEIERQTDILESGGTIIQQTLRYNDLTGQITAMRDKEEAADYRYFPDADIPAVLLTEEEIERFKAALPELPEVRLARYVGEYGLAERDAVIILNDKNVSEFFDKAISEYNSPKTLANFVVVELLGRINRGEADMENLPFGAEEFAELQKFVDDGKVNRDIRKEILREMIESGKAAKQICDEKDLWLREDSGAVEAVIEQILAANPKAVEQYCNGEMKVFGFLMGLANKELKGSAAPATVKSMLESKLKRG